MNLIDENDRASEAHCFFFVMLGENEYIFAEATLAADTDCKPLSECTPVLQFDSVAHTATSDRQCMDYAYYYANCVTPLPGVTCSVSSPPCSTGQYQVAPPTSSTSRVCKDIQVCAVSVSFETAAPTLTTDRVCADTRPCNTTWQYQLRVATGALSTRRIINSTSRFNELAFSWSWSKPSV
jgi:hypothetical protein